MDRAFRGGEQRADVRWGWAQPRSHARNAVSGAVQYVCASQAGRPLAATYWRASLPQDGQGP
ncbi:hypothetical protein GCM10010286_35570 [Streptomyces toxytricini]|nr:hypothetical protein GCM10010286_35570 [Streptomyces toxytricini]